MFHFVHWRASDKAVGVLIGLKTDKMNVSLEYAVTKNVDVPDTSSVQRNTLLNNNKVTYELLLQGSENPISLRGHLVKWTKNTIFLFVSASPTDNFKIFGLEMQYKVMVQLKLFWF